MTDTYTSLLPSNWLSCELAELADLAPTQKISFTPFNARGITLLIRRDDMLHPYISGNKLYKLFEYLKHYRNSNLSLPIATFGGKYSNHVLALAAAGHSLNIKTIAVIRGDENIDLSETLEDAKAFGMHLHFVDRQTFKLRYERNFEQYFEQELGACFWVPEGGAGALGVLGASAIGRSIAKQFPKEKVAVFQACGTGSTLAGLVHGLAERNAQNICVYGVNVLKGFSSLKQDISEQIPIDYRKVIEWDVLNDFHCGGYAKFPEYLASFLTSFEDETGVLLDPVYTCKVIWALNEMLESGALDNIQTVLMVHSGGLQGRRGVGLPFRSFQCSSD